MYSFHLFLSLGGAIQNAPPPAKLNQEKQNKVNIYKDSYKLRVRKNPTPNNNNSFVTGTGCSYG